MGSVLQVYKRLRRQNVLVLWLKQRICARQRKIKPNRLGGKWLDVPMSPKSKKEAAKNGYGWMPGEDYIRDQAI